MQTDFDLVETLRRAEAGDTHAQVLLGWAYGQGGSLPYNSEKAESWLRKATQAGSIDARRRLARHLCAGNSKDALPAILELVEMDDFYGHYMLGHILLSGRLGLSVDKTSARTSFRRAANLGHLISEIDLLRSQSMFGRFSPVALYHFAKMAPKLVDLMRRDPDNPAIFR